MREVVVSSSIKRTANIVWRNPCCSVGGFSMLQLKTQYELPIVFDPIFWVWRWSSKRNVMLIKGDGNKNQRPLKICVCDTAWLPKLSCCITSLGFSKGSLYLGRSQGTGVDQARDEQSGRRSRWCLLNLRCYIQVNNIEVISIRLHKDGDGRECSLEIPVMHHATAVFTSVPCLLGSGIDRYQTPVPDPTAP